ncbi:hypothetical protein BH11ACT5_BH11ACT5_22660 [soil metagenome]
MDIHEYFGVLRRGWALVVLGLLIGIAGGVAANAIQPRTYAATSREILTNSEATGDLTQSLQASNLAEGRIASYVLVATSGLVLQPVIDELKLDMTVQELAGHLAVVAPPSTLIVEITATAATPELAKSIANTVSAVFSDVVENQIENATSPAVGATDSGTDATPDVPATAPVRIVNIEHASLPTAPTFSNAPLLLAVGAILGLALGLVGASLRETLDRRIRGRKDVAAVTERPVLGQIRPDRGVKASPIVMHTSSQSAIAESFRGLRASVEHVRSRDEISTFVITAMAPRQGASLVAANLALAIADTATTVVVVDANLQAPNQAEVFDVDAGPGLTDLLTTKISLDEVIAAGPSENIWVVPIGSRRAKSADLLATPRMRALLTELQSRFDVVVIDTPAISTATDATVLGSFGAATLLLVAEGTATRPGLAEALGARAAGGSVPAGIVLNQIPRSTRSVRPEAPAPGRTSRRVTGAAVKAPRAAAVVEPAAVEPAAVEAAAPAVAEAAVVEPAAPVIVEAAAPAVAEVAAPAPAEVAKPAKPVRSAKPGTAAPAVAAVPATVPLAPPVPVEEKVLEIAPPAVESTSNRAAARAARVAAKAAARAAASRPSQPVSRFAPKPADAVEAAESAAAAERRSWPAPIIDSVPVLEPVDESSNSVIDVPRGDTGERVTLLAPQPGDPTPEQLAEIVANQFKDDVVYEIPAETFGSFHLVDADAFAAVDNEPTILPPFKHTEPEMAPGTLIIDPAAPLASFSVPAPLTEENAAFVIDLLADEPVYDMPRFEDWAAGSVAADAPEVASAPDEQLAEEHETEPEFDASVYDLGDQAALEGAPDEAADAEYDAPVFDAPVFEVPVYEVPVVDAPVYEVPVVEAVAADAPVYEMPLVDAPVYDVPVVDAPVYEVPVIDAPVYAMPIMDAAPVVPEVAEPIAVEPVAAAEPEAAEPAPLEPISESTDPRQFIAPASWPVPRLVADWPAAPEQRIAAEAAAEAEAVAERAPIAVPEPVVEAAAPAPVAAAPEPEPAAAEPEPAAEAPAPVAETPEPIDEDTQIAPILARVTALPTRERLARESYLLKSRELERAAQERLRYEQERLEARIREQLETDRRQLAGKLDELLEDTVMMPRKVGDGS